MERSERNQQIHEQHKFEKVEDIRAQRRERLVGVTLYKRDAVPGHTKDLIPEVRGIATNDGSFDLTPKGQEFLSSTLDYRLKYNASGVAYRGLFIDPGAE